MLYLINYITIYSCLMSSHKEELLVMKLHTELFKGMLLSREAVDHCTLLSN